MSRKRGTGAGRRAGGGLSEARQGERERERQREGEREESKAPSALCCLSRSKSKAANHPRRPQAPMSTPNRSLSRARDSGAPGLSSLPRCATLHDFQQSSNGDRDGARQWYCRLCSHFVFVRRHPAQLLAPTHHRCLCRLRVYPDSIIALVQERQACHWTPYFSAYFAVLDTLLPSCLFHGLGLAKIHCSMFVCALLFSLP